MRKTAAGLFLVMGVFAGLLSASPAHSTEFVFPGNFAGAEDSLFAGSYTYVALGDAVTAFFGPLPSSTFTDIANAGEMAVSGTRLFVIARGADEIVEISTASRTIVERFALFAGVGSQLALDGDLIYYGYDGDKVGVLDTADGTNSDVGITTASADPLLEAGSGVLWVGERAVGGTLARWDVSSLPATFSAETAVLGAGDELRDLALDAVGNEIYTARKLANGFEAFDAATMTLSRTLATAHEPLRVEFDPAGSGVAGIVDAPGSGNSTFLFEGTNTIHSMDLDGPTPLLVGWGMFTIHTIAAAESVSYTEEVLVDSYTPSGVFTDEGTLVVTVDGDYLDDVTSVEVRGVDVPFLSNPNTVVFTLPNQTLASAAPIRLRHGGSYESFSIDVSVDPDTIVPGVPSIHTTEPASGQVTVGWSAPAANGGDPITEYTVTSTPGGHTCVTSTLSCVVDGLTNFTAYRFSVVATNDAGMGPASELSALATPTETPNAPTDLQISDDGVLTVVGGDGADEFEVQYRELEAFSPWLREIAPAAGLVPAIVNGRNRDISDHAYGVKLFAIVDDNAVGECGGVVIAPQWVLTAAHCTERAGGGTVDEVGIVSGYTNIDDVPVDPWRYFRISEDIYVHPEYDSALVLNDIALVRLEEAVNPGLADVIPIYEGEGPADNDRAYVSGWGATETGGFTSDLLKGVEVRIDSSCGLWPEDSSWDDDAYLCAGAVPKGFCQGDSGGPLVVNNGGVLSLVGLVSFNSFAGCGESSSLPDVYTRVSSYVDWIEKQTGPLWTEATVNAGGDQTLALDGLQPGRSYAVQVRAETAGGVSDPILEMFTVDGAVILGPADTGVDCTIAQPHPLTDVPSSSFASDAVGCIYGLGITTGTSPTAYSPQNVVTREQMAAFIARFYERVTGKSCNGSHPFVDVPSSSFASDAVGCIYGLGITTGTSPTAYSPQNVVTREQMAAFIGRLYRLITEVACGSAPPFNDVASSSFAFTDVGCIYGLGVTTGTSRTQYSPRNEVTREQMAAFLARLYVAITS